MSYLLMDTPQKKLKLDLNSNLIPVQMYVPDIIICQLRAGGVILQVRLGVEKLGDGLPRKGKLPLVTRP